MSSLETSITAASSAGGGLFFFFGFLAFFWDCCFASPDAAASSSVPRAFMISSKVRAISSSLEAAGLPPGPVTIADRVLADRGDIATGAKASETAGSSVETRAILIVTYSYVDLVGSDSGVAVGFGAGHCMHGWPTCKVLPKRKRQWAVGGVHRCIAGSHFAAGPHSLIHSSFILQISHSAAAATGEVLMATAALWQARATTSLVACLTAAASSATTRYCAAAFTPQSYAYHNHNSRLLSTEGSTNMADSSGVMMILSPAKTLDLSPYGPSSDDFPPLTSPDCDRAKTSVVATALKARSKKELEKLLGISTNLAEKSHQYWTDFNLSGDANDNAKPAIYAFSGAAYQGLDVSTLADDAIPYMQANLRIVDPLYGTLRPLDKIQPYRLEMATKNALDAKKMDGAKDLASWWSPAVSAALAKDLEDRDEKILLNIASDEYSAAVDRSALPDGTQYIKVVFQQEGRVIAVHAKKARGMMVRYLSENHVTGVEGVRKFSEEGYKYVKSKSSEDTIVFGRPKQAATKKQKKPSAKGSSSSSTSKKAKTK